MNDLKTIRQLIKMMVDNDLSEIDLEGEGEKIKLKRSGPGAVASAGGAPVQYLPAPNAPAAPAPAAATPTADGGGEEASDLDDAITIDSPMVGTFYTSSSPDADAFVSIGDTVKADSTVVCIVEAMKVFNEIKSDVSGKIVEVLVETGQAVEFGQPMFRVKP